MTTAQFRQGDVLLHRAERLPTDAILDRAGTTVTLVQHPHNGHAHQLTGEWVSVFASSSGVFLQTVGRALLTHDEHAPILVPAGCYRVMLQREYLPRGPRNVSD